jgi:hypothetical protein
VAWSVERLIPELLPLFVEPGEAVGEPWALGPLGGDPLSPGVTLAEVGVHDAPGSWRRSLRELAAVLAAAWPVLGATT